ncbi:MAG: SLBB domain-containing protein [Nostoc sp.]|uniref:SLBB domain-containing protein n=1 Tax=Nostoc sp. TaxID=1180 RepID=UPI002FF4D171
MLNKSLSKFLIQPVVGVALLTGVNTAVSSVSLAQGQPLPPTTQSSTTQTQLNTDYSLGGGDLIRVNVFEVPEYTGEYQVPPGGAINLPLIGSVSVLGLTTEQASDEIAKRYARFLKRPLISVNLLSPRPINIFVAGEVTRPGGYTLSLSGGAGNNPGVQYPTVLAALTTAQGVTLAADVTQVQLRRKIGPSSEQTVTVNLKELVQTGRLSQDITLRDGDTIVVPTATNFNVAESRNIFAANFAASQTTPRTVTIIGEVNRPGSYLVTPGNTDAQAQAQAGATTNSGTASPTGLPNVTRVIQLAGGITGQADVRNLRLRRPTRNGSEQTIDINLWQLLQSGDANQDIIVQDGDTIVIPTATEINPAEATQLATTTLSPTSIQVGVVGEVKKPGLTQVQPNSSLNQAILAAGGFNDARASSKAVDLIRLNPNGSVTKRIVKVDFSAGINEQTNPILRNNDVVVVTRSGAASFGDTVNTITGPLGIVLNLLNLFGL